MGIFGIYGERWKRFASYFKGFLALEERSEGRRAYYEMIAEKKGLRNIQSLVAEHKVSKAMNRIGRWHHHIAKAVDKEVKLGMSQVFQYFHILKITNHFVDILGKFVSHARLRGDIFKGRLDAVAQEMTRKMAAAVEQAEAWGGEDMRRLMAIINAAVGKGPAKFLDAIRMAFKNEQNLSMLGRISLRMDIKKEVLNEKRLDALSKELEKLDRRLEANKKGENYDKMLGEFERILFEGEHDIEGMFKAAHLIMKRDLLLMIMVLVDIEIMKKLGAKWVQIHFMPENPIHKEELSLEELDKKISDKAHTLANGLGVILKGERAIEQKLKVLIRR